MSITLYSAPMSSASPVVWALAELGLAHETTVFDLSGDAHKQPEFLALNPMGQVPTLVDGEQAMFESSACVIYLGEKYGVERGLWPAVGSPPHMQALTWTTWAAVAVGGALRQLFVSSGERVSEDMRNPAIAAYAKARFGEMMRVFEGHVADRPYVAGEFSLADCYVAGALGWATHVTGFDRSSSPNLDAYLTRCLGRKAAGSMN
jgi:glutathione S-transferase